MNSYSSVFPTAQVFQIKFQILGPYLHKFVFNGPLKYSTCSILTIISYYLVTVLWGL